MFKIGRNVYDLYIYPGTPMVAPALPSLELIKLYKSHECPTLITLCKVCQVFFKTFFYSTLYKVCQVFYKVFFRHLLNLSSFAKFYNLVYEP